MMDTKVKKIAATLTNMFNEGLQSGYADEFRRKMDLLTLEEKEIVRKSLEEPYDKSIGDEFVKIVSKLNAKH